MASEKDREGRSAGRRPDPESGQPGGGAGRKEDVRGSGVHPASAGSAPADSEIRNQAGWGQGDRGPAGYDDSGSSELFFYEAELKATEAGGEGRGGESPKSRKPGEPGEPGEPEPSEDQSERNESEDERAG